MPQATEFDIPFQPKTSPYLAWVRPRTLTWVREHDLLRSDDAERRFLSWDLTRAAALIYANAATRDDLLKIANFFALGFLFDDQADYRSPESVDRFVLAVHEMIAIPLRPPTAPLEFACPATRALRELWERMTDEMSPLWCDRFALDYGRFQASNAHEARLSARAEVLELPAYLRLRRATVGLFYSMDQTEWAGRYELAPRVLTHPVFAGLREATNDTVAWMNDIHSHDREAARQDPHNLLTVLARHHDLTAAQAVGRATDMTYSALRRFVRLRGEVPAMLDELRLSAPERDAVGESVAGMENWLRGNHDWARATGRYRSTGDAAECPEDLLSVPAHTGAV
ncbi:terpene synthase family protein [Amycolatopsis lurida]